MWFLFEHNKGIMKKNKVTDSYYIQKVMRYRPDNNMPAFWGAL